MSYKPYSIILINIHYRFLNEVFINPRSVSIRKVISNTIYIIVNILQVQILKYFLLFGFKYNFYKKSFTLDKRQTINNRKPNYMCVMTNPIAIKTSISNMNICISKFKLVHSFLCELN